MDQREKKDDHARTSLSEKGAQTRRAALKKIAVGGGLAAGAAALPLKWTQPIIDRVLIPAHAQTSPGDDNFDNSNELKGQAGLLRVPRRVNGWGKGSILYFEFVSKENTPWKSTGLELRPATQPANEFYYKFKAQYDLSAKMSKVNGKIYKVDWDKDKCTEPGNDLGAVEIREYTKGEELEVRIWGSNYPLDPVGTLTPLPELVPCPGTSKKF